MKEKLLGKSLAELKLIVQELGFPSYSAKQISEWLYQKTPVGFDDMTNLSLNMRSILNQKYISGFDKPESVQESVDGNKK